VVSKLARLINLCLEKNIPFVSFKLPDARSVHTWVQISGRIFFSESITQTGADSGFVYAPFHRRTNCPVVVFKPEWIFENEDIPEHVFERMVSLPAAGNKTSRNMPLQISKEEYLSQADGLVKLIGPDLKKVVLSRVQLIDRSPEFNEGVFFLNLIENYPGAFSHIIHIPGAGTWTGASPETLLRMDGKQVLIQSLAGTKAKTSREIPWGKKEKEEQQIVTDYIIRVLNRYRIEPFHIDGPTTIEAGNALHLTTSVSFESRFIRNRLFEFLEALHPTPAVCGVPKEEALEAILGSEKHNREYYSGYCGLLNVHGRTDLFVNLRCMKLVDPSFALFSGGGITADSVAESEWQETELKNRLLLSVIQKF
jgi:isochorismate synthase